MKTGRKPKSKVPTPRRHGGTPPRIIGRISDDDWEVIQQKYRDSGVQTFTEWARAKLMDRKPQR